MKYMHRVFFEGDCLLPEVQTVVCSFSHWQNVNSKFKDFKRLKRLKSVRVILEVLHLIPGSWYCTQSGGPGSQTVADDHLLWC